jgi:hypothetical protein
MATPTAATATCSTISIQSMPGVTATPITCARKVPTIAPMTPITMVSQIGMFCLPQMHEWNRGVAARRE